MSITVKVSEQTEARLKEIARRRGQDVAEVAGVIIEKNINSEDLSLRGGKKFSELAGMFYGGDENISENASAILRAEMGENSIGKE
jgi:predicted transcriptional regulator